MHKHKLKIRAATYTSYIFRCSFCRMQFLYSKESVIRLVTGQTAYSITSGLITLDGYGQSKISVKKRGSLW